MINYQGLVKPSYHAYRMLNQLGDEKLYKNDFVFVSRDSGNKKIKALAYNYPIESEQSVPAGYKSYEYLGEGTTKKIDLQVTNLKPNAQFKIEILDKDHGNIHSYWEKMGKPEPPTREQIKVMKKVANNLKTSIISANENGVLVLKQKIEPWNVVLIEQIN